MPSAASMTFLGKEECPTTTGLETILAMTSTVTDLVGNVWTLMTSNPLLLTFLCVSLLGVGIGVFRMIKGAAHK